MEMSKSMTDGEKLLALSLTLNQVQADTTRLEKIVLIGNGELPLVEQVRNHEVFIRNVNHWSKLVAGIVVAQFLGLLGAGIWAFIRVLPVLEKLANQP
jgi:predicted ATP-dependent Lon-type protease